MNLTEDEMFVLIQSLAMTKEYWKDRLPNEPQIGKIIDNLVDRIFNECNIELKKENDYGNPLNKE